MVQEGGSILVGLKPLFAVGFLPAKGFPPSLSLYNINKKALAPLTTPQYDGRRGHLVSAASLQVTD